MLICVDFDDTVVSQRGRDYADVTTPLQFMPGARQGLLSLKAAGHTLVLYSGRANRSLRVDPNLDPLVRVGLKRVNMARWEENRVANQARFDQMIAFVDAELPGVFAAVDDGVQGKPSADMYIDDKALRLGYGTTGLGWTDVSSIYGNMPRRSHG